MLYVNTTSVRIVNSTFSDNIIPDDRAAIIYNSGDAWLEGTALVNNSVILPLIADRLGSGGITSDVPREIYSGADYDLVDTAARADDSNAFLSEDHSWFQNIRAVRSRLFAIPPHHASSYRPSISNHLPTCIRTQ